jgi:hypothetical protein
MFNAFARPETKSCPAIGARPPRTDRGYNGNVLGPDPARDVSTRNSEWPSNDERARDTAGQTSDRSVIPQTSRT